MSKKKNFKGVATSIVGNNITSLDDFLGADDNDTPAPAQAPSEQKPESARQNPTKKVKKPRPKPVVYEEPEKIRVSLFLSSRTSFDLDELKMNIRRTSPRQDMSKISKSSIVEAAIDIVKAEFEEYGIESDLVQKILN